VRGHKEEICWGKGMLDEVVCESARGGDTRNEGRSWRRLRTGVGRKAFEIGIDAIQIGAHLRDLGIERGRMLRLNALNSAKKGVLVSRSAARSPLNGDRFVSGWLEAASSTLRTCSGAARHRTSSGVSNVEAEVSGGRRQGCHWGTEEATAGCCIGCCCAGAGTAAARHTEAGCNDGPQP